MATSRLAAFFATLSFGFSFSAAYRAYARTVILAALRHGIRKGTLRLEEPSGQVHLFGAVPRPPYPYGSFSDYGAYSDCDSGSDTGSLGVGGLDGKGEREGDGAVVIVRDDNFWVRVYGRYDVGFSEAYMEQEMDTPDMKAVLNLYIDNLAHLDGSLSTLAYRIWHAIEVFCFRFLFHGLKDSKENVAIYNVSNDMYQKFLSAEMMYSCPIWAPEEGGVRGDLAGRRAVGDLEAAQARKVQHVLDKARVRAGDRVLEIGSGWGSMAIAAAARGATVHTLTLNSAQRDLAVQRIAAAGLAHRVSVHLMDYREMPAEWAGTFDACVSVEMLEAVGYANMKHYVRAIHRALKPDRGTVVLTSTTYPDPTYTPFQGNDFVRMYHWRHTVPPSPVSLMNDFQRYSGRGFTSESLTDFGPHYPRCLREWSRRLAAHWPAFSPTTSPTASASANAPLIASSPPIPSLTPSPLVQSPLVQSLTAAHPSLREPKALEAFRRRWMYMFVYMEVAYARQWLCLHEWVFTRVGEVAEECQ